MPETRAMTVAFLDEVMPINGPLLLIPKNHTPPVMDRAPRLHADQADRRRAARIRAREPGGSRIKFYVLCAVQTVCVAAHHKF